MAEEIQEQKKKKFKLSSLFFEDEPAAAPAAAEPVVSLDDAPVRRRSGGAPAGPAASAPAAAAEGNFDKKVYQSLLAAIDAANLEGFDYLEFKNAIEGMKDVIAEEDLRFKSAFASAVAMGVTKARLVETANFYVSVLDKEEKSFKDALAESVKTGLGGKEKELKSAEDSIREKSQQIKKLTGEIDALQQRKLELTVAVEQARSKVDETKNNFYATFEDLKGRIKDDLRKIETYLK